MITIHLVGENKADAKTKFAAELIRLLKAQPIHVKDAVIIEKCVNAYIDVLVDGPDYAVAINVTNHLEGRINNQPTDFITLASLNFMVQLVPKAEVRAS